MKFTGEHNPVHAGANTGMNQGVAREDLGFRVGSIICIYVAVMSITL